MMGRTLGHYQIIEKLGEGGMGVVYKAQDTRLHRFVALKFLSEELSRDRHALERFEREAQAASALNHPNICTIHDIDEHEGRHFIAMEFLEGKTLKEHLTGTPLQTDEILDLAVQIADGLDAAHSKGIFHRDIKPANVFVTTSGRVKILDFGLAKLAPGRPAEDTAPPTGAAEAMLTGPGTTMGTVDYMSPEQALAEELDTRTDLFSFGVLLYEMATGVRPFHGTSSTATLDAILHKAPTAPARINPGLPALLEQIINKALEKDRDIRYQVASEMRADLKRLKRDSDSGKDAISPALGGTILRPSKIKSSLGIAAVLAIVVIPFALYLSRQKGEVVSEPLRIVPLTAQPGAKAAPRFSPDGRFVAFQWNGTARDDWDIYVTQVGHGEPLRLTSDPADDVSPAWSPDGGEVAFVRRSGEVTSIYSVPSLGGAERKLYESGTTLYRDGLSWSPDGRLLAFPEKSAVESPSRIVVLPLDTRQKTPLTSPPLTPYGDIWPEFSPDGKRIAFIRVMSFSARDIWVQPVSSGESVRLTQENYEWVSRPAWTSDGYDIVFSTGSALFRVPAAGGVPQAVAGVGENAGDPNVWRNAMVFAQNTLPQSKIWRIPGPSYKGEERSAVPLLASTRSDLQADYSPDGTMLTFASDRSGFSEIWVSGSDGSKPLQLTNLRKASSTPRWSPDGRSIVFGCRVDEEEEIYVIGADGGMPRRLTNEKSGNEVPSWSRDGRWIYFASNRSGTYQVWKMPAEGGDAVQVTRGGGFYAVESLDGRTLYYVKPGRRGYGAGPIWKVSREGGEETPVMDRDIDFGNFALRKQGIYFATRTARTYVVELLSPQAGRITPFYKQETPNQRTQLAISPDGEWLVYHESPPAESDLRLVENFR